MKMQEKYKQLLEALLESSKEFLNSQELGELAGISQRTVIRYMKELKEQSLKYGFFAVRFIIADFSGGGKRGGFCKSSFTGFL